MIDIYLIRHGKASSGWDNLNPDLGIIGKKQSKNDPRQARLSKTRHPTKRHSEILQGSTA